jgi:dihydrolipoamide dehydrogenase
MSTSTWFETVAEAHRRARKRLPKSVYGALVAGSEKGLTTNDNIAAPQLADRGFQRGLFVAEELDGLQPDPVDDTAVPRVVYSHQEVAAIGLTEDHAHERYGDAVRVARRDLAGNAKSHLLDTVGTVKIIGHRDGKVLGIHMIGDRVGELIGEAQLLHGLGVTATAAAALIHAHPTQGEALGEALLAGKPLHTHS